MNSENNKVHPKPKGKVINNTRKGAKGNFSSLEYTVNELSSIGVNEPDFVLRDKKDQQLSSGGDATDESGTNLNNELNKIPDQEKLKELVFYGKKFKNNNDSNLDIPKPEDKKSDETSSASSKSFIADKNSNPHFKNFYEFQTSKKSKEHQKLSYMQKLIISDLIGTFFAISGLIIEMVSSRKYYQDNAIRVYADDGSSKEEHLNPNSDGSSYSFLQSSSSFCTFVCIICIILSYNFELNSLIQRNMVKNTCSFI